MEEYEWKTQPAAALKAKMAKAVRSNSPDQAGLENFAMMMPAREERVFGRTEAVYTSAASLKR